MKAKVRPMTTSDWQRVHEIYQSGIETNLATFETECPPYEVWDQSHFQFGRLVIVNGSEVLGWAALSPVSSRRAYAGVAEISIYMAERARGKGLGKVLLEALVACSEDHGIWTLQAGIMQDNTASIHLHEKCGFRMVGYRERIGQDRWGVWRNTVLMVRRRKQDDHQAQYTGEQGF